MEKEWVYRLALTRVPGIGPVNTKILFNHFGKAEAVFHAGPETIQRIKGIGPEKAKAISGYRDFQAAENELALLEKYKMRCLFFTDTAYPQRLLPFNRAPAMLFYRGDADLNAQKVISVVGTRSPTEYGKQAIDNLIKELKELEIPGFLIVSGLAYGIDAASHQAAVNNHIPTVGILGHGLSQIYPPEHAALAKNMIKQGGGLLTEFGFHIAPKEVHFPQRNKIVAGICDAVIIVETKLRGGSMLTVQNALDYQKQIFAFPGRVTDPRSSGCNELIAKGTAKLLTAAPQFLKAMQWTSEENPINGESHSIPSKNKPLPDKPKDLSNDENLILNLLQENGSVTLDELLVQTRLSNTATAMALLTLECKGLVGSHPGKLYRLKT